MSIGPLELTDAVIAEVLSFARRADGCPVQAERKYVDDSKLPTEIVKVNVYPIARQKQRNQNQKTTIISIDCSVQRALTPQDSKALDAMVQYVADLDSHFETAKIHEHATYVMDEDETFIWLPDWLHQRQRFVALINLKYKWKSPLGQAT